MDYLFPGPWGEEMAAEYSDLAHRIADVPGLICKVWGDAAKARQAYQEFFEVWKDADADIPILIEAKKEYETLG